MIVDRNLGGGQDSGATLFAGCAIIPGVSPVFPLFRDRGRMERLLIASNTLWRRRL